MRISEDTRLADVCALLPYLRDGEEGRLCKAAEARKVPAGWWSVTIGEFVKMSSGDFSPYGVTLDDNAKVLDYYFIKAFAGFVEEFTRVAGNLTPKGGIPLAYPMTMAEGLLVFARRYFGCRSFLDAERLTLGDWLMAKKDDYNRIAAEQAAVKKYGKK